MFRRWRKSILATALVLAVLVFGHQLLCLLLAPSDRVMGLLDEVRHMPDELDIRLHRLYLRRRVNSMGWKDLEPTVQALVKLGSSAAPQLRKAASEDPYASVRMAAVNALVDMRDPAVGGILRDMIAEKKLVRFALRRLAWERPGALLPLPRDEAVSHLTTAMKDESVEVRVEAAMGLGKLADPASAQVLLAGLEDAHCSVRMYSAEALGKLGDPQFLPVLSDVAENDESLTAQMGARRAIQKLTQATASTRSAHE